MDNRQHILQQKTVEIISRVLKLPPDSITNEKTINELSEDSIQLFELLLAFEEAFSMRTAYDDVVKLKTVGDIVSYLVQHESVHV